MTRGCPCGECVALNERDAAQDAQYSGCEDES